MREREGEEDIEKDSNLSTSGPKQNLPPLPRKEFLTPVRINGELAPIVWVRGPLVKPLGRVQSLAWATSMDGALNYTKSSFNTTG